MDFTSLFMDLKQTLIELISDIKENIPMTMDEKGDLALVEFYFSEKAPSDIMKHFIAHVLPYEKQIQKRDSNFFIKNKEIFGGLPSDRVDYFGNLWKTNRLTTDDKETIWTYFQTMVDIAKKYKKNV